MIKMKIQLDGSNCSKATNIESVWSISSEKIMSKSPVVLKSVKIEEFFRIQNCNSLSQNMLLSFPSNNKLLKLLIKM